MLRRIRLAVLSIVVIAMMSWFTSIITWFICTFVTVASIAVTVVLWLTYYDVRSKADTHVKYSYLEEFIRNENALYALAIIATITMVTFARATPIAQLQMSIFAFIQIAIIVVIYLLRSKLSGLAALFEEASTCMLTMPGLIVPSLVALVTLLLFFAFWVAVVVCLVTAKYPHTKSLIQQTPHNVTELQAVPDKNVHYRSNNGSDYKSFSLVEYSDADILRNLLWFYFVGLIWTSEFIFGKERWNERTNFGVEQKFSMGDTFLSLQHVNSLRWPVPLLTGISESPSDRPSHLPLANSSNTISVRS